MTKAVLITAGGEVRRIIVNGYDDLRNGVGGYIEGLRLGDTGQYAFINEDGKLRQLPVNQRATQLCFERNVGLHPNDFIVGNMIVVGPPDADGNETDVSEEFCRDLGI